MSIVWIKELGEETRLALWKIEEGEEALQKMLVLNDQETLFINGIRSGKRTLHWLASRVLLRNLLGLNPTEFLDTRIDDQDKPFIFNKSFHFSISHSFEYAGVMISRDHLVGMDIEQINDKIVRIEDKFMSEEEKKFIEDSEKINHLYACWSAKEALYKLFGKKTVSFRENIHLHPFHFQKKGTIDASLSQKHFFKNFKIDYEVFDGYMVAYVRD
jgi:phosphopantetheinyl transferase